MQDFLHFFIFVSAWSSRLPESFCIPDYELCHLGGCLQSECRGLAPSPSHVARSCQCRTPRRETTRRLCSDYSSRKRPSKNTWELMFLIHPFSLSSSMSLNFPFKLNWAFPFFDLVWPHWASHCTVPNDTSGAQLRACIQEIFNKI